jgi:hypothetical protein
MNPHAQALGKLGGKAGTGKAKARTSEQARAAVNTRWAKRKKRRRQNVELSDRRENNQ